MLKKSLLWIIALNIYNFELIQTSQNIKVNPKNTVEQLAENVPAFNYLYDLHKSLYQISFLNDKYPETFYKNLLKIYATYSAEEMIIELNLVSDKIIGLLERLAQEQADYIAQNNATIMKSKIYTHGFSHNLSKLNKLQIERLHPIYQNLYDNVEWFRYLADSYQILKNYTALTKTKQNPTELYKNFITTYETLKNNPAQIKEALNLATQSLNTTILDLKQHLYDANQKFAQEINPEEFSASNDMKEPLQPRSSSPSDLVKEPRFHEIKPDQELFTQESDDLHVSPLTMTN